jgi:hypothetical protein
MAATTPVTLEDFIKFSNYRNLSVDEQEQIQMFLDQAARQITSFLGSSDWSIPADPMTGYEGEDGSIAKDRQFYMVKRYYDNQRGLTSESFDGLSVTVDDRAYEGLRLTPYDKQVLTQNRIKKSRTGYIGIHRNYGNVW